MKKYLQFGILLLVIPLLLLNCEKEELVENRKQKIQVQLKSKSYSELQESKTFNNTIAKVFKTKKTAMRSNYSSKTVMEEQYGFTIDSTLIKEIKVDGYTSYTFLISREISDDSYFENLIVTKEDLGEPKAYIVKYTLNSTPIFVSEDNAYSIDATKKITSIKYDNTQAKVMYEDPNGCLITLMCPWSFEHEAGDSCIEADRGDLYWSEPNCDGSGGGTGTSNDNPDTGNPSGSTSGSSSTDSETNPSGGSTSGNIITSPISCTKNCVELDDDPCPGGKVYNDTTKKCECPDDKVEDSSGNCIDKPCEGDPVPNPEIAPQKGKSGVKGALHGCNRYGGGCSGGANGRNKKHDGIDIKNPKGSPVFALFDGKIHSNYSQKGKAGHVTRIRSVLPSGDIIIYQYFHLQKDSRLATGKEIKAGDIIGIQGDSGNLKGAVSAGTVDSHVHIKMNLYDGSGDSNDYSANFKNNPVNPSDYMGTKFDSEGNKTNCN